ncbi:hypothetical protein AF72_01540 [Xylella taiwanensis]|uniref:Uncharacterized protein n=1 Tax=Xylella taiwanensis TaxID=1444770 RepID=Z9JM59_9GAMM|nr:hypothetical protein AF72_01540 [Xylella taiwanensis]
MVALLFHKYFRHLKLELLLNVYLMHTSVLLLKSLP